MEVASPRDGKVRSFLGSVSARQPFGFREVAPAQVRGLRLGCKLRFGHRGLGGGLPAAGAKILAIFSPESDATHTEHTLNIVLFVRSFVPCAIPTNTI